MTDYRKITFVAILFMSWTSVTGQSNAKFLFYDPCSSETISLDYELWHIDTTIYVKNSQPIYLEPDYYMLVTNLIYKDSICSFHYDIIIDENNRTDTLYLYKVRSYGRMILHDSSPLKYYDCGQICHGKVVETDKNGVLRFKGTFKDGIPISNLTYYSSKGIKIRTDVYRNGNLKKIKGAKFMTIKTEPHNN